MKFNTFFSVCYSVFIFFMCFSYAEGAYWAGLRDGVLHIKQSETRPQKLLVSWKGKRIANAQYETLYWSAPTGDLLQRVNISPKDTRGQVELVLPSAKGDYRFEIPGYSFRKYTANIPSSLFSVFEPVKLHFSAEVPNNISLYFQVPAGQPFILAGKNHGGVDRLEITNLTSNEKKTLSLTDYEKYYSKYDQLALGASPESAIWKLTLVGGGKAAFWLDGIPNLFALDPKDLFEPELQPGMVEISINKTVMGDMPLIGAALDFSRPPASADKIFDTLKLRSANYYFYEDILEKNISKDISFLDYYEKNLNIKNYISILAKTGRRSTISDANSTADFLVKYLINHRGDSDLSFPLLAIADEPNLNYDSYAQFEEDFVTIASALKNHPDPDVSSVLMAVPQSSRFISGPSRSDSDERIGAEWTEKLLKSHSELIGSISWHEWLVRDLVATEKYQASVERAHELDQRYPAKNGLPRPLILAQTNISSGNNLSPYEQDTFFAGLWLASVVVNSSLTGQLDQLNWFKIVDDGIWNKGLVSIEQGVFKLKPVAHAMAFINEMWLPKVLNRSFVKPSIEFELLPVYEPKTGQIRIFGVNKSLRPYTAKLDVSCLLMDCNETGEGIIKMLSKSLVTTGRDIDGEIINSQHVYTLSIPPETIFFVEFNNKSSPAAPEISISTIN